MFAETSTLQLGQELSDQEWGSIGQGAPPLCETTNKEEMINKLTSILTFRLEILLTSRKKKHLPTYRVIEIINRRNHKNISDVSRNIHPQLRNYISCIASGYRDVGYHSLEHAVHVTASLNKIVSLMIDNERDCATKKNEIYPQKNHIISRSSSFTYGNSDVAPDTSTYPTFAIGCDPLIQFALVFAALIHDVEHPGVPNHQLTKECDKLTMLYNDRSVAEQNSLYVALTTLNQPEFAELRHAIMHTDEEMRIFRKTVIDIVLSTDISGPERVQIGKSKWKEAFESPNIPFRKSVLFHERKHERRSTMQQIMEGDRKILRTSINGDGRRHSIQLNPRDHSHIYRLGIKMAMGLNGGTIEMYPSTVEGDMKLKASSVMEQVIQAADVSHTMQSWSTFIKWNKKLYDEQWKAFMVGRGDNPSIGWYENQLCFYDFYIIPLTLRLLQCGVFGQYGYDFLHHARENRQLWLEQGKQICQQMVDCYQTKNKKDKRQDIQQRASHACVA